MEKSQGNKTDEPLSLASLDLRLTYGFCLSKLAKQNKAMLFARARRYEGRMIFNRGRPLKNRRLLEIGSGQGMECKPYNTSFQQELFQLIPKGLLTVDALYSWHTSVS